MLIIQTIRPSTLGLKARIARYAILVCAALFTTYLPARHQPNGQLPLDAVTRAKAAKLRRQILNPMYSVKKSKLFLRELARIPDPLSFIVWRRILLHPSLYPSTLRQVAARTLIDYRGIGDDQVSDLLTDAIEQESVREVMWEIAQGIERRSTEIPPNLRLALARESRPEWRAYETRALQVLEGRFPVEDEGALLAPHARALLATKAKVIDN